MALNTPGIQELQRLCFGELYPFCSLDILAFGDRPASRLVSFARDCENAIKSAGPSGVGSPRSHRLDDIDVSLKGICVGAYCVSLGDQRLGRRLVNAGDGDGEDGV